MASQSILLPSFCEQSRIKFLPKKKPYLSTVRQSSIFLQLPLVPAQRPSAVLLHCSAPLRFATALRHCAVPSAHLGAHSTAVLPERCCVVATYAATLKTSQAQALLRLRAAKYQGTLIPQLKKVKSLYGNCLNVGVGVRRKHHDAQGSGHQSLDVS